VPGSRVILAIAAGIVAVVALIAAGFLLLEPDAAPCASGELADNDIVDGAYQNRIESFDSVSDAESFICHDVPELHADGWALDEITAERSLPLDNIVDGDGFAAVHLTYRNDELNRILQFDATPFEFTDPLPSPSTEKDVKIDGRDGRLIRGGINPNAALVLWTWNKVRLRASTQTDAAFPEEDLLRVLGTAR
jgi:hypothetical protein